MLYEFRKIFCIFIEEMVFYIPLVWFQVIVDEAIVKLHPDFFWLGGGEVDLKLGIRTSEFIDFVKPFIVSCSGTWFPDTRNYQINWCTSHLTWSPSGGWTDAILLRIHWCLNVFGSEEKCLIELEYCFPLVLWNTEIE